MSTGNAHIQSEQRNGNLFITICGNFDSRSGPVITAAISGGYNGLGNIFVDTEQIKEISADRNILTAVLTDCRLPRERFFLIGCKGSAISPDGCRVIIRQEKKCCGRCSKHSFREQPPEPRAQRKHK